MRERSSKIRYLFYAILFLAMAISMAIPMQAALAVVGPAIVWVDGTSTCTGHTLGTDCFATIQEGINAVVSSGTVNVLAGTLNVTTTILVNKSVTITGETGAIVQGTDPAVVSIFEISASDVTLQNLEITHNALPAFVAAGWAELPNSLVRVPVSLGLTGLFIQDNKISVPAQAGEMKTWNGVGITVGSNTTTGLSITGNTIFNLRDGVVVQYGNTATINTNDIHDTKGGIMNYTSSQADADNRTVSNNTWGTTHNEWDIVWNSAYYVPDYNASVLVLSGANNDAYVLDRRATDAAACAALTGNRSHIFVDAAGAAVAAHPAKGNFNEPFATVQLGIDAVVPGGTVYVGAGTYTEQVTVAKSLSLFGDGAGSSIISAPATLPASSNQTSAIVRFNGTGVTSEFTGFTVTGPGPAACGSIAAGILVSGGADANIHDNTIADVRDSVFSGCQNGIAIQVGRNAWSTTGTATIENNIVTGYQKGGIVVDNAGSSATITGNTVTGAGTTEVTAQNGIQISRGATATLSGNTVSGNSFHLNGSTWDWGAAGILLYQAGAVSMTGGNSIHDNDQNLYVDSATAVTVGSEVIGPSTAPLYSGYEVINYTALNFDLTGVTFSEANNCQIEERIWHGVDDTTSGAVYWVAGNLYVASPESTIQNAIDKATAGDTINVCAATYAGNIKIDRSVTILGDPGDTTPGPGANAPVIDGNAAIGDAFLIANGVSNVTIQGFEVRNFATDDNNGIGNAISAWVGSTSNITVQDNYFHDLEYNAVLVGNDHNADPVKWGDHTGWTIKGNILDNVGYIGFELTNTSNSSIEDNIIHLDTPFIGAIFSSARRSESGLTVKNNLIDGIPSTTYPIIYMYAYDLDMPNPNLDSVLIEGNTIDCPAGTPYQVYMRNIGTGTVTGVQVINNSFLRLKNLTSATIDASSNYWGSSDPTIVAGNISGIVDFSPLLDNGTDTDLATMGFQPDFSSYTVHTLGSQTGATSLIQEGINLVNGSTLNVVAGTYAENININKSLNLVGAQAGVSVAGRNAGDAAEATIQGLVSVNASDVIINGFTLTNPGQTSAMTIPPSSSNTRIIYNMIDNVGAPTLSSNVHSIVFQNGADSVNISHNSFNNINANAKSASGISVLDSVSTDPSNDLVIKDNTFTNIASVTKGAYGIIINNKAGAPGAQITYNTFSGLNGNWTHAIGLETDIINPVVADNNFSNLTANGAGSDVAAIFFEADPSSHTARIKNNRFEGTTFYGVAIHPSSITLGYTANAVKNWWGDASGPGLVGEGTGALVSTNVDYTPWCTDMDCTSVYYLVTGNVTASDGTFTNRVRVTWDAFRGANRYILYRGTTDIAADATELVRRNGTAYADRTATPGVIYYYWVKGCYFADCSDFSASDDGWMGMLPPADLQASDGVFTDKVQITWTAALGATSYEVYRSKLNEPIKTLLDSPIGTTFDDTTAIPGVYYKYWVRSCAGTICSDFGRSERGWRNLPAPENLDASDGTYANKVQLTWTASDGATSYKVYRATSLSGTQTLLGGSRGTSFADTTATKGVTYYYWVKAYRANLFSDFSTYNTGWRK